MVIAGIHTLIGGLLLVLGAGACQGRPWATARVAPVRSFFRGFLGEDFEIHDIVLGALFILIGCLGLLNAFMMYAAEFEFWVV